MVQCSVNACAESKPALRKALTPHRHFKKNLPQICSPRSLHTSMAGCSRLRSCTGDGVHGSSTADCGQCVWRVHRRNWCLVSQRPQHTITAASAVSVDHTLLVRCTAMHNKGSYALHNITQRPQLLCAMATKVPLNGCFGLQD